MHRLIIRLPITQPTRIIMQFTPGAGPPVAAMIQPLSRLPSDLDLSENAPVAAPAVKEKRHEAEPFVAPRPPRPAPIAPPRRK